MTQGIGGPSARHEVRARFRREPAEHRRSVLAYWRQPVARARRRERVFAWLCFVAFLATAVIGQDLPFVLVGALGAAFTLFFAFDRTAVSYVMCRTQRQHVFDTDIEVYVDASGVAIEVGDTRTFFAWTGLQLVETNEDLLFAVTSAHGRGFVALPKERLTPDEVAACRALAQQAGASRR